MNREQLLPFLFELRDSVDTALFRFGCLESAAKNWLAHQQRADTLEGEESNGQEFSSALAASSQEQLAMFDALESFLAVWARVSLLLYPTSGNRQRGEHLRAELHLSDTDESVLNNRELRDSWMHFDERLDAAVQKGTYSFRYRWTTSNVAKHVAHRSLRLFVVDSLVIYIHNRKGSPVPHDLEAAKTALQNLRAAAGSAWRRVGRPPA